MSKIAKKIKEFFFKAHDNKIKEKLRNARCYMDPSRGLLISSPPQKQCDACCQRWTINSEPPICEYIRKADILNLNTE